MNMPPLNLPPVNLSALDTVTTNANEDLETLSFGKHSLADRMRSLIQGFHPEESRSERRLEKRYPYPSLLRLRPYDEAESSDEFDSREGIEGRLPDSMTVVGHEISLHGIGFYHQEPIADRLVVIEFFDDASTEALRVLVDLSWCRFAREGWYESGGRLVREIASEASR